MKSVKFLSISGLAIIAGFLVSCGSSQPSNTLGYNSNGLYGTSGVPPYGVPGAGGQIIIGGQQVVQGNYVQANGYVNAGETIHVNLSGLTYSVQTATCGSQWYNTTTLYNPPGGSNPQPISNVTVTFNGQAVTGSMVAPTSGMVILNATLNPSAFNINCGALYSNSAVPRTYFVNLGYAVTR